MGPLVDAQDVQNPVLGAPCHFAALRIRVQGLGVLGLRSRVLSLLLSLGSWVLTLGSSQGSGGFDLRVWG